MSAGHRLKHLIDAAQPVLINKTSKLFWPVIVTPKNAVVKNVEAISRSQKLMTEMGLVRSASNGTFHIMPLAQRSLDKCVNLVQRHMLSVEGQKISLPILTSASLWQKTGRLDGDISEFYMVRDRHDKEFLLSPTHEEAVTSMLAAAAPISYKQLPLRLYQIGAKFRDELKSRFGLLRAKEFLMKDMYTFDRTVEEARETYEQLTATYNKLLRCLQVPYVKVEACAGMMGGLISDEFHYISETGEDSILQCSSCGHATNAEVTNSSVNCIKCAASADKLQKKLRGIEVAHAFLLGDKYSRPLGATFLDDKGKPQSLIMGCYGIGISRLVAAALEVLSTETELRWPKLLAPFDVCIIGPKQGSKEQATGDVIEAELTQALVGLCGAEEVLQDDRKFLTIGKRLMDAKRMGYPLIVVVGAKSAQSTPKLELHMQEQILEVEQSELLQQIANYVQSKKELLNC